MEVRLAYAGALIDQGDADEAIRQLREVIRLDPGNAWAYTQLSLACLNVLNWSCVTQSADKSIALDSRNYEPYLWKADALRRVAASEDDLLQKSDIYRNAADNYRTVLRMTNFETPAPARLAFFLGLPTAHRSHADRQASYASQRQFTLMGLCQCEDKLGNFLQARNYCSRAVEYDPKEPMSYFFLGNVYRDMFNASPQRDYLLLAKANYIKTVEINPDLDVSPNAEKYIQNIDQLLVRMK